MLLKAKFSETASEEGHLTHKRGENLKMQFTKKQWLLIIIVGAVITYLLVSKVSPEAGWSVDNVVGGALGGIKASIEATPFWQQYDVWITMGVTALVLIPLMWKVQRKTDDLRGIAHVQATQGGSVTTMMQQPTQPTLSSPITATQRLQPTPQPVEPPKQEQPAS